VDQPTAEAALRELEPLIGEWTLWRDGDTILRLYRRVA
jgi:hypothetical protein